MQVENIAPVVQEIPLPARASTRMVEQEKGTIPSRMSPPVTVPTGRGQAGQVEALDDLTIIEGIGPVIAGLLQQAGITTFAQLAETDLSRLEQILREAHLPISDPTTWADQARLAANGNWDGLRAMQDELKGGRLVG
jgi:predicted flap endonuclease-1-like 5' DNA nuclease